MSTYVYFLGTLSTLHLRGGGQPVVLTVMFLQIHRAKAEKARERQIKEEMDAKRARTKAARERKVERQTAKRNALLGDVEEESK